MARTIPSAARGWVAWLNPGVMILVGPILFFAPAPPTSLIGIVPVLTGAVLRPIDYAGGDELGRGTAPPEAAGAG